MSRQSLLAGLIAVLLVSTLVGVVIYRGQQSRLVLTGDILKVRSHQIDPASTIAILDFRLSNPSPHQFVVRRVEVFLEDQDGGTNASDIFSDIDAQRVMSYYKILGEKHNKSLIARDSINPGQTIDRMMAIRFGITDQKLQSRKAMHLVVHDVDGGKAEIVEKR